MDAVQEFSTELSVFDNEAFGELRVSTDENGDPWFVAADVCRALDLSNTSKSLASLDDDEKGLTSSYTPGGEQKLLAVTEAGFYRLVLKSRKPEAKAFQRWVTHEVLPAIRSKGGYMVAPISETPEQTMARALLIAQDALKQRDERIAELLPNANAYEAVLDDSGTCNITQAVRYLAAINPTIRRDDVFRRLREDGMLCQNDNSPTRAAIDTGRFVQRASRFQHKDGRWESRPYARVTNKGIAWMLARYGAQK